MQTFSACFYLMKLEMCTQDFVQSLSFVCFLQYNDEEERNGLTQGDKLRALKSKRQSRSSTGSLS